MKNYSFCILMAAAALVGCSQSDNLPEQTPEKPLQEIRFTANEVDALVQGEVVTRADTSVQNRQFDNGQYIDVYITEAEYGQTTSRMHYPSPITFVTTDINGTMSPFGYTYPYYQTETLGNGDPIGVTIRAVYPQGAGKSNTFTVSVDQTEPEGYRASDLMYGLPNVDLDAAGAVTPRDVRVPLLFHHLLSKIQVKVEAFKDEDGKISGPDPTNAIVKLMNVDRTISFDLTSDPEHMLGARQNNFTKSLFVTTDASKMGAAIIPPQTVGTTKYFMEITLANNDVFYYTLGNAMTFESGKKYTFFISVKETKLSVRCVVEDWVDYETPFQKSLNLDS